MNGLIGKKVGMTQVFAENGEQVPVTLVQVGPCVVVQRKTAEQDGYEAVQLGFEEQKPHRLTRAQAGHFKKAEVAPCRVLCEFAVDKEEELAVGQEVTAALLDGVAYVDISGVSKGRGFQGVVRRHGMAGQPASHGSKSSRRSGSIGQCEFPARVFKGKKMPGQMGHVKRTVQNLAVFSVSGEDHLLLVKGAVPGPNGGIVLVRKAIKKTAVASS